MEAGYDMTIDDLLRQLVEKEGSDLHLRVGEPPVFRIHGALLRSSFPTLTPEKNRELIYGLLSPDRREKFETEWELDCSYSLNGVSRFRVNCFRQGGHPGAVLRVIPFGIKTVDDLGLPGVVKEIGDKQQGLVLVTGPTGSGKSTTLAAMIDYINTTRKCHIITIEDPIEFLHQDKLSTVNQREVEVDTLSFASALKHVMRQNPDVILVGELRDLETIGLAITAAETGHLVLATLHTTDAPQTVDRMVDVFPPGQQQQIRLQLSTSLHAVISQTLLPRRDGKGRAAAFEIMICHSGLKNLIREGKTHQLYGAIQTGGRSGMQLLDQHLRKLVEENLVSFEDALGKSSNPQEFARLASRGGE